MKATIHPTYYHDAVVISFCVEPVVNLLPQRQITTASW